VIEHEKQAAELEIGTQAMRDMQADTLVQNFEACMDYGDNIVTGVFVL
jgi:hypothetical protein